MLFAMLTLTGAIVMLSWARDADAPSGIPPLTATTTSAPVCRIPLWGCLHEYVFTRCVITSKALHTKAAFSLNMPWQKLLRRVDFFLSFLLLLLSSYVEINIMKAVREPLNLLLFIYFWFAEQGYWGNLNVGKLLLIYPHTFTFLLFSPLVHSELLLL